MVQCGEFRLTGLPCISSDVDLFKNIVKTALWIIYKNINAANGKFHVSFINRYLAV